MRRRERIICKISNYSQSMFVINARRIIKSAWLSFRRSALLSTATVITMVLTLFVIGGLLLLSVIANAALSDFEGKIDISMYFRPGTEEPQILKIKNDLALLPEVKTVRYVSQEEALLAFQEKHKRDEVVLSALEELGDQNPLGAALTIKAKRSQELASIGQFLSGHIYDDVEKITYFENEAIYERLVSAINGVRSIGVLLAFVLSLVAVLVASITVRLAIFMSRDEINVMKLVGASNWFVRGPFLVIGIINGGIAALVTSIIFLPIAWASSPRIAFLLPQVNLFEYFIGNFFEFFFIMALIGISLGVFSSAVSIRKYLKV